MQVKQPMCKLCIYMLYLAGLARIFQQAFILYTSIQKWYRSEPVGGASSSAAYFKYNVPEAR